MKKEKPGKYTKEPKVQVIETTEFEQHDLFQVINHNGEFMIALGNNIVSKEKFESREEACHYIDCKPWELIFNSTAVMITKLQKLENENK